MAEWWEGQEVRFCSWETVLTGMDRNTGGIGVMEVVIAMWEVEKGKVGVRRMKEVDWTVGWVWDREVL